MPKLNACLCAIAIAAGPVLLAQEAASRPSMPPSTRPATAPAADADENPFIIADAPVSNRPPIPANAVVRLTLVDGFLLAQTTMPASAPQMQKVEGLPNPVHVGVTHRSSTPAEAGAYYSPDMLQITYVNKDGPRWIRTSISTVINHLSISRDSITNGNEHTIQYIQSTMPTMAGNGASLYIQSLEPELMDQKQSYSAEHFAAFIRKYPAETTQYLRPMVEVLGPQPHLFVVDDPLACSVFPEAFATDGTHRGEILAIVNDLNADDFRKRQDATAKLEQMGVTAAAVLATLDRASMPPEQAARVDAIISRIKPPYDADVKVLRNDPGFSARLPSVRRPGGAEGCASAAREDRRPGDCLHPRPGRSGSL